MARATSIFTSESPSGYHASPSHYQRHHLAVILCSASESAFPEESPFIFASLMSEIVEFFSKRLQHIAFINLLSHLSNFFFFVCMYKLYNLQSKLSNNCTTERKKYSGRKLTLHVKEVRFQNTAFEPRIYFLRSTHFQLLLCGVQITVRLKYCY